MKKVLVVVAILGSLASMGWTQDEGASIYKSKCASCHGADGSGKTGPNLKTTSLSSGTIELL